MKNSLQECKKLLQAIALFGVLTLASQPTFAQVKVGDNPETINDGSVLEIESDNKGLLLPRVILKTTTLWGLEGTPVAGMQVFNRNADIFEEGAYDAVPGGIGVYYWDGNGWVGTKNSAKTSSTGDFDWLKTSDNESPSVPEDISAPIFHGGFGNQEVTVRTTGTELGKFAQITTTAGFGSAKPIVGSLFAQHDEIQGRVTGLQSTSPTVDMIFRTTSDLSTTPGERMRITRTGLVGIGTPIPTANLQVFGRMVACDNFEWVAADKTSVIEEGEVTLTKSGFVGSPTLNFSEKNTSSNNWYDAKILYNSQKGGFQDSGALIFNITTDGAKTGGDDALAIVKGGRVGMGTLYPGYKLDVVGDINVTGEVRNNGVIIGSDSRLKRNIQGFRNGLDVVSKLNPVSYEKKNSIASTDYNKSEIGFIAQEVRKILPQLVREGKDTDKVLALDYNSLIPVLTRAIQEQQKQIEALNVDNKALTGKVSSLEQSVKLVSELSAELSEIRQMLKTTKLVNNGGISK